MDEELSLLEQKKKTDDYEGKSMAEILR